MRRRIAMVFLLLGTIGGYAAGFHSLKRCGRGSWSHHSYHQERSVPSPEAFGDRVAP